MNKVLTFLRGLAYCCPSIVVGFLIARFVPPLVIVIASAVLLCFVIYIFGVLIEEKRQQRP